MKKSVKILLAAATLWPILYMFLFISFAFISVFLSPGDAPERGGAFPSLILLIFPLHLLTMLLIMALMVFYMVNVFRNERVDKDKKVLWAVVLFMGGMIAMPIYWYLFVWPEDKAPSVGAGEPRSLNSATGYAWANDATAKGREGEYVPPQQPPDWR